MSTLSPTARRSRPLAELRSALASAARSPEGGLAGDAAIAELVDGLSGDSRAGARALADQARRLLATRIAERARIARLLERRDTLAARGVRGIAGVDEVGVGPLAGSVIAAAVVLPERVELDGLDDSKRVPAARRALLAAGIREVAVGIGIGEVMPEEIDQRGVYRAAVEAMRRAVASLARITEVGHLLIDGRSVIDVALPQTPITHGDQQDASIAAASIVAKVHRDALMRKLGRRYPAYGFERHMGYGTPEHVAALERFGPCPIHRLSFAPVAEAERRFCAAPSFRA